MFWIGFIGWIAETAYFGFNLHPKSELEKHLDGLFQMMFIFGALGLAVINYVRRQTWERYLTATIQVTGENMTANQHMADVLLEETEKRF